MANDKRVDKIIANARQYSIKQVAIRRDLDAVNGTLIELASVVATLINDLKKQGILK